MPLNAKKQDSKLDSRLGYKKSMKDKNILQNKANNELDNTKCEAIATKPFSFIDLFAGIGGIRLGFERAGGRCVFSSEIDKYAAKVYEKNFNDNPFGDVREIDSKTLPYFDVLCAGFPCQPFSIIGDKKGFSHSTQGTLFFEIERILKDKSPKAFMLENVRNLIAHDKGNTLKIILSHLKNLGYFVYYDVLNALDFGLPQKRERIIICGFKDNVNFSFPKVRHSNQKTLKDILESSIDKKYFVKDYIKQSRQNRMKKSIPKPYITHKNIGGSITPHHFSCALRAGASANYLLVNNERRLSEREMLRLQGFPEDYKIVVSYNKLKMQIGNSVAVPVIEAVAREMIKAMDEFDKTIYKTKILDNKKEKYVN